MILPLFLSFLVSYCHALPVEKEQNHPSPGRWRTLPITSKKVQELVKFIERKNTEIMEYRFWYKVEKVDEVFMQVGTGVNYQVRLSMHVTGCRIQDGDLEECKDPVEERSLEEECYFFLRQNRPGSSLMMLAKTCDKTSDDSAEYFS